MATRISSNGEILDSGLDGTMLLYSIAKVVFGADANGIVTIPDDASALTGITATDLVTEIAAKT